ncbi:hypothetical protein BH20ACT10_BH20ACT10_09890 [soil metagenome]|jgi:ubiquinone/menaquinone biosynthesis C-methylase UbiE
MGLANPANLSSQYANAPNLDSRITLHRRFSVNKYSWHRWVFDQFDFSHDARILEVGRGNTALCTENRERMTETWRITLPDASPGMIEGAERNINLDFRNILIRNFTFTSTDAQGVLFGDGEFGAVVANHMLYHIPDRVKAVSRMARISRPGGVLYAATDGRKHMREVDGFITRLDPDHPEYGLARRFSGFTLENGEAQLFEHFAEVSLSRHKDELRVTEAGPLLAWALSTVAVREIAERVGEEEFARRVSELFESLEEEISEWGEIRIAKDAGLFAAKR